LRPGSIITPPSSTGELKHVLADAEEFIKLFIETVCAFFDPLRAGNLSN
jgi:hypothetical protein